MKTTKLLAALISAGLAFGVCAQAAEKMGETVDMASLPANVQSTIKEKAAGGQIVRVVREDDPNGRWNYEVVVKKEGKESQLEIDPNGKFVKERAPTKADKR